MQLRNCLENFFDINQTFDVHYMCDFFKKDVANFLRSFQELITHRENFSNRCGIFKIGGKFPLHTSQEIVSTFKHMRLIQVKGLLLKVQFLFNQEKKRQFVKFKRNT